VLISGESVAGTEQTLVGTTSLHSDYILEILFIRIFVKPGIEGNIMKCRSTYMYFYIARIFGHFYKYLYI
jgi:hypothetical protein